MFWEIHVNWRRLITIKKSTWNVRNTYMKSCRGLEGVHQITSTRSLSSCVCQWSQTKCGKSGWHDTGISAPGSVTEQRINTKKIMIREWRLCRGETDQDLEYRCSQLGSDWRQATSKRRREWPTVMKIFTLYSGFRGVSGWGHTLTELMGMAVAVVVAVSITDISYMIWSCKWPRIKLLSMISSYFPHWNPTVEGGKLMKAERSSAYQYRRSIVKMLVSFCIGNMDRVRLMWSKEKSCAAGPWSYRDEQ